MQMANNRVVQKLVISNMTTRPLRVRAKFDGSVDHKFGSGHGTVASWTLNGPNAGFDVPAGPGVFPIEYEVWEFGGSNNAGKYTCTMSDVRVTYAN